MRSEEAAATAKTARSSAIRLFYGAEGLLDKVIPQATHANLVQASLVRTLIGFGYLWLAEQRREDE